MEGDPTRFDNLSEQLFPRSQVKTLVARMRSYRGDLPGSRSASCLGCGRRVVTARDSHVCFGGRRDGSLLIAWETKPQLSYTTRPADEIFAAEDLYFLGVAHGDCAPLAKYRLEGRTAELEDNLPALMIDEEAGALPALDVPPTDGSCAFCARTELTDEHVFPKWVSNRLRRGGFLKMKTDTGSRRVRSVPMTAPVCSLCNNRWLSVLERDIEPLLGPMMMGQERPLGLHDQVRLATWAVKTALMLDLASGKPIVPRGFYHALRLERIPHENNVVLCGAYLGSRKAIWADFRPLGLASRADGAPAGFVATFGVFRLVFQVIGHFTNSETTLNDRRALSVGLLRLWPQESACVKWPRDRLAFNDDALSELAASVAPFTTPPGSGP